MTDEVSAADGVSAPEYEIPVDLQGQVAVTSIDRIYNWGRRSSIWPLMFGLACCAIEMICTAASRYDLARFGMEVMRPSPRQADLIIVSGTVTKKMIPQIVRLYNQMPEPKYVLAMGACASGGGPFKEGYNVVSGVDKYVPVDVYVPGCPPTPQALLHGLITLQEKIDQQSLKTVRWYRKEPIEPLPVPILGPDILDPRDYPMIREYTARKLAEEEAARAAEEAARAEAEKAAADAGKADQARESEEPSPAGESEAAEEGGE